MMLIELPFYMKQVLRFNIKENALGTSLPFFTLWLFSMALSKTLDKLRARGTITTTLARKVATLFASAVPMVCLFALCYIGCQRTLAVIIMGFGTLRILAQVYNYINYLICVFYFVFATTGITSIGGMFCGFLSNHIDIAPSYAGTLMAITNTAATIPGIIVPLFVAHVTHGNVCYFAKENPSHKSVNL